MCRCEGIKIQVPNVAAQPPLTLTYNDSLEPFYKDASKKMNFEASHRYMIPAKNKYRVLWAGPLCSPERRVCIRT